MKWMEGDGKGGRAGERRDAKGREREGKGGEGECYRGN